MEINVQTKTRGARIKKRFTSHAWFTYTTTPNGSPLMGRVFKTYDIFLHGFVGF